MRAAYDAKLKSGDILSVAEVIRDLHRHDTQQEQSYSERCLYEHALQRMGQEIGAARKLTNEDAIAHLRKTLEHTSDEEQSLDKKSIKAKIPSIAEEKKVPRKQSMMLNA